MKTIIYGSRFKSNTGDKTDAVIQLIYTSKDIKYIPVNVNTIIYSSRFKNNTKLIHAVLQLIYTSKDKKPLRSEEADVGGGRSDIEDAGPQEAAGKVDYSLNVLVVRLHVGCDGSLVSGHAPLVGLTVDG